MLVKFACICDLCGTRGEEYEPGYTCVECGRDICGPPCALWTDDETGRALCWECDLSGRSLLARLFIRGELLLAARLYRLRVLWKHVRGARWFHGRDSHQ